ncbi:MAG: chromate transporter [Xanthobacteraceae bacterium]|nr:chromate transporter [Xanthobacteraceae bacterium]
MVASDSSPLDPDLRRPDTVPAAPPGLFELFLAFAKMSLAGFGGVLVWARRAIVEQHRWMTPDQFNEAFALCHFLPGPNIVNLSVVFGARFRGIPGSIAAFLGLLGPPVLIVTTLAVIYSRYGEVPALQRTLNGVSAAAVGLFVGVIYRMMTPLLKRRNPVELSLLAAVFIAVGLFRFPLPWVLAIAVPLSIAVTYAARMKAKKSEAAS